MAEPKNTATFKLEISKIDGNDHAKIRMVKDGMKFAMSIPFADSKNPAKIVEWQSHMINAFSTKETKIISSVDIAAVEV